MPVIPFSEYRPDVSNVNGSHTRMVENVFPRGDGYGPVRGLDPFTTTLGQRCRGSFVAIDDDDTVSLFAGTDDKLLKLDNSSGDWEDVSNGTYALSTYENWQFRQFGRHVLATQQNNNLQVFTLGSSANFADVSGSPPRARYISIVGEFVVLSGLQTEPYRIHWSGLNDITSWTPGTDLSDFQDFGDGGIVRGVAGGEYGVVLQDRAIRRLTYAPGSPVIFSIDRISEDEGLMVPGSLIRSGEHIFFLSASGFHQITAGGPPVPIGREKFDRTFFEDWDDSSPHLLIGVNDPNSTRVLWCYKSSTSTEEGVFDRVLVYDWLLQRPAFIKGISGQYAASAAEPGITLEGLDSINTSIDALPQSLDDYISQFGVRIAMFDSNSRLAFLTGPTLKASLETPEFGGMQRVFIRGARPESDAPNVEIEVSSRPRLSADKSWSAPSPMNVTGNCPLRMDARFYGFRATVPAATDWTFISGIEPDIRQTGMR